MNKLQKIFNWIFIVLCVVLSIMLFVLLCSYRNQQDLMKLKDVDYSRQIDSLENVISDSEKEIGVLQGNLLNQKEKVVVIKDRNNEKVDSVVNLPIDGALEFFAKSISEETVVGR